MMWLMVTASAKKHQTTDNRPLGFFVQQLSQPHTRFVELRL
jgi:hypothetical protein